MSARKVLEADRVGTGRRLLAAVVRGAALVACVSALWGPSPCRAEDSAETRYYFALRLGEKIPGLSDTGDVAGASAGMNWGRVIAFELALDSFEVRPEQVAEISALALLPQARVRWPLLSDRVSPYLLAGAGLVVSQANDARVPVNWEGGKTGAHPAGTLGGGVDLYFADNLAIVLEGKYLISGEVSYETSEGHGSIGLSNGLFSGGLRVFYPELHPGQGKACVGNALACLYVRPQVGFASLLDDSPFHGVKASAEQPILGSDLDPLFGVALGAEFGRYASVEVSFENYEIELLLPDVGRIGEYAVFPLMVQPRFRYPLLGGNIEPYAVCGIGAEFAQLNDKTPAGRRIDISGRDATLVGAVGAGLEYRIMSNVTLGGQIKYVISRGHEFEVAGVASHGNLDSLLFSLGMSVVLFAT